MKPKLYKPGALTIVVMVAGLGMILFLKIRKNGWEINGWMDVAFYCITPVAVALVATLFFARIRLDDERVEIVGLLSRDSYPLADITEVSTEKGATVSFKLRAGRSISLPFWVGAEGWGVAAALRSRLKASGRRAADGSAPASPPES